MPQIQRRSGGSFCWFELGTTDQAGARNFYSSLFGWTASDFPIGENEYYTTFKLNGSDVAAAYTMRPGERSAAPPHWNLYIAVESADDTVRRTSALGGAVLYNPLMSWRSAGRL
jgi:predicted enzyme related to lactoylglutathione lyase